MLAAVQDVEHRHGQDPGAGPAEVAVQRQVVRRRRGMGAASGHAEDGVGPELGPCSASRRARSARRRCPAWSAASAPIRFGAITSITLATAFRTPLPPKRALSPSRSSTASLAPVEAPDGTAARPTDPSASTTSTSTVGLPRESRISRARTTSGGQAGHRPAFRPIAAAPSDAGAAVEQDGDPRQLATLEELERGAAAGRDVGHPVGQALLLDRGDRIAAADDDRRAGIGPVGQEAGDRVRPMGERGDLEDAERAVPEHGLGRLEGLLHERRASGGRRRRCASDAGIFSAGRVLYSVPRVTSLATITSTGRTIRTPLPSAAARIRRASSTRSGSARLLPTLLPWASRNVLAMPAADDEDVDLVHQVLEDLDLAGHLGAADRRRRTAGPGPRSGSRAS